MTNAFMVNKSHLTRLADPLAIGRLSTAARRARSFGRMFSRHRDSSLCSNFGGQVPGTGIATIWNIAAISALGRFCGRPVRLQRNNPCC